MLLYNAPLSMLIKITPDVEPLIHQALYKPITAVFGGRSNHACLTQEKSKSPGHGDSYSRLPTTDRQEST